MPQKIRVLVVDDAVVIRKILSDELEMDGDIEVVGTAANGKIALQKIPQLQPDIITLDVEMPEMDGLETLTHIRKHYPKIPVVMFSTLTERGGIATMEALARGASDYVTKPSNVGNVTSSRETVRKDLVRKIRALVGVPSTIGSKNPSLHNKMFSASEATVPAVRRPSTVDVIVIGVSTCGPNALAKVIPMLPKDLEVPVLIVQHMPSMFTRLLAERLNAQSTLSVVEATDGMPIQAGTVYIAPGDFHLTIGGTRAAPVAKLNTDQPENSCRPAVDVLFRSAVSTYKGDILAVILTGMGQDGMIGSQYIKEAGGFVIAQDKATSVVWGMPGAVVDNDLADKVLPLENIALDMVRVVKTRRSSVISGARL